MNEKFFIVKEKSDLYQKTFEYKENALKVYELSIKFLKQEGIEANEFYAVNDVFAIVPSSNDLQNFDKQLRKKEMPNGLRFFKETSRINKAWLRTKSEAGLSVMSKPFVPDYFNRCCRYGALRFRLFDDENVVYASLATNGEINTPEGFVEIKASEFFKVVEGRQC